MSAPESIMIDDVKYVKESSITKIGGDVKIVIADRGFVFIGHIEETTEFLIIRCAKSIRRWGTTKGLGELVNGPLQNTVLDLIGEIKVPARAVIGMISVDSAKWKLS